MNFKDIIIKAPFTKLFMNRVAEKAVSQDEFGHGKYGKYLDPDDDYDWLNMAEEEYVDLGKYFYAERLRRDKVLSTMLQRIEKLEHYLGKEYLSPEGQVNILSRVRNLKKDIRKLSRNLDGKIEDKATNK